MTQNNAITLNVTEELAELREFAGKYSICTEFFVEKGKLYLAYGIQTGNLDMCRALRAAMGFEMAQKKHDSWVKVCAAISKKKLSDGSFTYKKDKTRARKEGWKVLDDVAFQTGFVAYKKPKAEKEALTIVELLELIQSRTEGAMDAIEDSPHGAALDSFNKALLSVYEAAERSIEAMNAPKSQTNEETVAELRKKAGKA